MAACATRPPAPYVPEGAFRLATFNIGFIRDPEGLPRWNRRRGAVIAMLETIDADIVAFQEMGTVIDAPVNRENIQLDWIERQAPGYRVAAVGDPAEFPSTQPILYRPGRFELVDQDWFFFSERPDVIYSSEYFGRVYHYAVTVRFRERATGRLVTVINLHPDAFSPSKRRLAANILLERVRDRLEKGERLIVAGDFNATANAPTLRRLEDLGLSATGLYAPTYHGGIGLQIVPAIDHILHGPGVRRHGRPTVHRDRIDDLHPSDHYPVSAIFRLTKMRAG